MKLAYRLQKMKRKSYCFWQENEQGGKLEVEGMREME